MDKEKIEYHVRGLLEAIGENPDREGLVETPSRVADLLEEMLEGTAYSNHEIAQMFGKTFSAEDTGAQEAVVMKDITVFSYCEHHLALMYDMTVSVAYIPHGRVLGLSKIARICDMAAKRLQLQYHSCMTARGIRNASARTETRTYTGDFKSRRDLQELLD